MIRVLVATDGSPHAMQAAELAVRLIRELREAEVILVNVGHVPPSPIMQSPASGLLDLRALEEGLEQAGEEVLDQTMKAFTDAGISSTRAYRRGDPAGEIIKLAQERRADLIIIGSRGRGQIGGLILGSVSERVLHGAHTPVLIVR